MTAQAPADWYPDPFRRFQLRYWNGAAWTEHVATRGAQGVDAPLAAPTLPTTLPSKQVQRATQLAGVTAASPAGGGTLFSEPVLIVSQKAKVVEINAEYSVRNQLGWRVGAVREVGQSVLKKAVRADRLSSHRLQVIDVDGQVVLTLTQPVAVVRSKVMVRTPDGSEVGEIVQTWASVLGKMTFGLESGGEPIGSINAEDWDSWDFNIQDARGNEVARVTKTPIGLARELFSKTDDYVVTFNRPLEDPLRSLVIAAALALDTMLRQGQRRAAFRF